MTDELTHFDAEGRALMVDIGSKAETTRLAVAVGEIRMQSSTLERIMDRRINKGDVLGVARLAGIMAAKQTAHLIPLCHPLPLSRITIEFEPIPATGKINIRATAGLTGRTGVEMEALTAVSIAALTIYDMCKAVDKEMEIGNIFLLQKSGGKSGSYQRQEDPATEGNVGKNDQNC